MESKAMPYPACTTVFWLPLGAHAIPKRGAKAFKFSLLYQLDAFTNVTGPCEPSRGKLATDGLSLTSVDGLFHSQRIPYVMVKFFLMRHSSWPKKFTCFARSPTYHR